MGIDTEIKQAKFRNNQNKAMVNIMFTHAWMVDHIKSFVKSENITPSSTIYFEYYVVQGSHYLLYSYGKECLIK